MQGFFNLTTNTLVAITQGGCQSRCGCVAAAARILAELVADFISGFLADSLVTIVQSVDQGAHDFGIAHAVKLVAELVHSLATILGIASRL
jgi:hypothetical protein